LFIHPEAMHISSGNRAETGENKVLKIDFKSANRRRITFSHDHARKDEPRWKHGMRRWGLWAT